MSTQVPTEGDGGSYVPLEPEAHEFEEGVPFEGTYLGSQNITVKGRPQTRHDFLQNGHEPAFLWGSTVLDGKLRYAQEGQYLSVSYLGVDAGSQAKMFAVHVYDFGNGREDDEGEAV